MFARLLLAAMIMVMVLVCCQTAPQKTQENKFISFVSAGGGKTNIQGPLDSKTVDAYFKRNLAKIRWCYEQEKQKNPQFFGELMLHLVIAPDGTVVESNIATSTMGNPTVENCILEKAQKIRFPKSETEEMAIVDYPMKFLNYEKHCAECAEKQSSLCDICNR